MAKYYKHYKPDIMTAFAKFIYLSHATGFSGQRFLLFCWKRYQGVVKYIIHFISPIHGSENTQTHTYIHTYIHTHVHKHINTYKQI